MAEQIASIEKSFDYPFFLHVETFRKLLRNFESIAPLDKFTIRYSNEMTKHASSLDELLALQNSGAAKIRSIEFDSRFSIDCRYSVKMGRRYSDERINYSLTVGQDKIDGLHQRIEAIFGETRQWYGWVYRVVFSLPFFILSVILSCITAATVVMAAVGAISWKVTAVPIGISLFMGLLGLVLQCLGPILFPTYGFEIGEGLRRMNQARGWRRWIGGVISGLVVIIAGIVITHWSSRLFD